MKIFEKDIQETFGCLLMHSVFLEDGRIRKGKIIDKNDIAMMERSDIEKVQVGELEDDDIGENAASGLIAKAIATNQFSVSPTLSGKTNITSIADGLIEIDEGNVTKLNNLSPNIAVSTLNNHDVVYRGDHTVSVKIISFVISSSDLDKILNFLKKNKIVKLKKFKSMRFGVIYTIAKNEKRSLIEKTKKSIMSRIGNYNSTIMDERVLPHNSASIKNNVVELLENNINCILLFLSTSVTDVNDIVPTVINDLGGKINSFGMPVDPGNLTLSGKINDVDIIVAAGSARSDSLNGFDWHLNCLHANIEVSQEMVNSLGVGGLLKDIDFAVKRKRVSKTIDTKKSNIAAVVLCAGESKRMGNRNKLLLKVAGKSLIKNYIDNISKSNVSEIVIVTGYQSIEIERELEGYDVKFIHNEKYREGMSTSLNTGINSLSKNINAAIICLPDMPMIGIYEINKLIEYYNPKIGNEICIATYNDQRGNPVLWDRKYFKKLMQIKGDKGGRYLLPKFLEQSVEVVLGEAVAFDVDNESSYKIINTKR